MLQRTVKCVALALGLTGWGIQAQVPDTFTDVSHIAPDLVLDIRYFGDNNFVGAPVDGYQAPKCYLASQAAEALAKVQVQLRQQQLGLKIFDCYRPQRAVSHFVRWAADLNDTKTKAEYYPNLAKDTLIGPYISDKSGHSRGATIDLTLVDLRRESATFGQDLDMGGPYDLFDPLSNTAHPDITPAQQHNRQLLLDAMAAHGFANYPMEWWHFTYRPEPFPNQYFDFIVE